MTRRRDEWHDALIIMACILGAALVALLWGCGPRLSDGQAQSIADARAGAQAAKKLAAAEQPDWHQIAVIYSGVGDFTLAATEHLDLPSPVRPPERIIAEAPAYAAAGKDAVAHPPEGWTLGGTLRTALAALGGTGAIIGTVLALGKNVPGLGGAAFTLADTLWTLIAPKKVKEAEKQAVVLSEKMDDGLDVAVAYGEYLATALKRLGQGELVEAAKDRASFLAENLGARDEIKRRLELVRSGDLHPELSVATLPSRIQPTPPA